MNRTELIDFIAEKTGLTKVASASALDSVQEGIIGSLENGGPVALTGFGTFTVRERAAREGRNPATGEKILIKKTKNVAFKAGKALKDAVKRES